MSSMDNILQRSFSNNPTYLTDTQLPKRYRYHAFLTHADTDDDREKAEQLREELEEAGFKISCESKFEPGTSKITETNKAISESRRVIHLTPSNEKVCQNQQNVITQSSSDGFEQGFAKSLFVVPRDYRIPPEYKNDTYIDFNEEKSWERLCNTLSAEDVKIESRFPVGNIGQGLAWSFYYGYCEFVMPSIPPRIKEWLRMYEYATSHPGVQHSISKKLFIIIPKSCYCPNKFEYGSKIQNIGSLKDLQKTVGGVKGRPFKNDVLKIQDESGKDYYCIGEFATPVLAMYDMTEGNMAGLSPAEKTKQTVIFHYTLEHILTQTGHRGKYKIIFYKDSPEDSGAELAAMILREIKDELKSDHRYQIRK